jgi:hypothetical protein
MAVPFEDLYDAAQAIMADVASTSGATITLAPTNFGTDFAITPAQEVFQVQIQIQEDYKRSNVNYPRAIVTILIHHYVTTAADAKNFVTFTMGIAKDKFLSSSIWGAETRIFSLDPDDDPDISGGERIGDVITFEITATVLMDAA